MNNNQYTKRNLKGMNQRGMSSKSAASAYNVRNNTRNWTQRIRAKHLPPKEQNTQNRFTREGNFNHPVFNRMFTAAEFAKFVKGASQPAPPPRAPSPPRNTRKNKRNNRPNYYNVLKVPKNAANREIRIAYRKLALEKHPNKGGNEEEFKKIQTAQETLSNADKRSEYDQAKGFKKAEVATGW